MVRLANTLLEWNIMLLSLRLVFQQYVPFYVLNPSNTSEAILAKSIPASKTREIATPIPGPIVNISTTNAHCVVLKSPNLASKPIWSIKVRLPRSHGPTQRILLTPLRNHLSSTRPAKIILSCGRWNTSDELRSYLQAAFQRIRIARKHTRGPRS